MQIINTVEHTQVPISVTIYQSNDGLRFKTQEECETYESLIEEAKTSKLDLPDYMLLKPMRFELLKAYTTYLRVNFTDRYLEKHVDQWLMYVSDADDERLIITNPQSIIEEFQQSIDKVKVFAK